MELPSAPSAMGDARCGPLGAWLYGVDDIRLLPVQLPPLGPHDVRVRVKAVGICGSDVHYLKHMQCAGFRVRRPMVLGHESAGEVLQVGSAVASCRPGDRVALEPGRCCCLAAERDAWGDGGCPSSACADQQEAAAASAAAACAGSSAQTPCQPTCQPCASGRYNLCPAMRFFATPPVDGSLAHEVVHPARLCFVLPPSVSLEEGALCEPLSVAVHACRRAAGLPPLDAAAEAPMTPGGEGAAAGAADTQKSPAGAQAAAAFSVLGGGEGALVAGAPLAAADATASVAPPLPPVLRPLVKCLAGRVVAVLGAGPIGLLVAATAAAFGAPSVVLCDVSAERVAFARERLVQGNDPADGGVITVAQLDSTASDAADADLLQRLSGGRVAVSFDCVGVERTLRAALQATASGGRVVLIGMGATEVQLPMAAHVGAREVDLVGVFRYCHAYAAAVQLLATRRVDAARLVTHRFGFSQAEVEEGFRMSAGGGAAVKVMFNL